MIKDKLINANIYYPVSEKIKMGLEWLKTADTKNITDGRYYIHGEGIYANVQSYETKSNADFEAHRRYIDIQYIASGIEKIEVADYSCCTTLKEYDESNDIEFLLCNKNTSSVALNEGEFMILFPHDAHKPSLIYERKIPVKKIVLKIAF